MADAKLIVRLKGGLGNQLFCYATGRRLALKSNAELVFDDVTGFKYDHLYKRQYALGAFSIPARMASARERLEPFGRIRRLLMRKASEPLPMSRKRYIRQVGVEFEEALLTLKLQPGMTYFDGFGQSERYFADVEAVIRQDLQMRPPNDPANQEMSRKIHSSHAVALHVRWFDTNDHGSASNMSRSYYQSAIDVIRAKVEDPHFFIFSDEPKRSAELLEPLLAGVRHTFVDHNRASQDASSDFWLMSQCQHFVIGNSTFAWWAAWLGEQKGLSTVVAPAVNIDPGHNSTAWGFPYLLPERWLAI
jgi:hypothetical protein